MIYQFLIILKKHFKVLLSTIIIISLGVGLLFGLLNGTASVHRSIDNYVINNNYPDIKIITDLEEDSVLGNIDNNLYSRIDSRISFRATLIKDNIVLSTIASTYDDITYNDFYVWDEINNNNELYDVFIEKSFADTNDIHLGDRVLLDLNDKEYDFIVTKIVSLPENINNEFIKGLWGKINDYGSVYIHKNVFASETSKLKDELLDEVNKKEEEIDNSEIKAKNEYKNAKSLLSESVNQYNDNKKYYDKIKDEIDSNIHSLNETKTKLDDIKTLYLDVNNYLKKLNKDLDSYLNSYSNLSVESKKIINSIIDSKYANVTIDDIEFVSDTIFYYISDKVDKVFDPESEINHEIMDKIAIADGIKALIEFEHDFFNSDSVNELIDQINNGEDVSSSLEYVFLKTQLELVGIFGEINEDNIVPITKIIQFALNEIDSAFDLLPFSTFEDLYDTLKFLKNFMSPLYDNLKQNTTPSIESVLDSINEKKEIFKDNINHLFDKNDEIVDRLELINNLFYNYTTQIVDEITITILEEYYSGDSIVPIEIINELITEIDTKVSELSINKDEIDDKLSNAYLEISNKDKEVNDNYNHFLAIIVTARDEIKSKKDEIINLKGYESKFNEINVIVNKSNNKEAVLKQIVDNDLKDINVLDSYTYDDSPVKHSLDNNIMGVEALSFIVPTLFYIIILVVLFLFISLIIKQSKKEIAILRLIGKTKNQIRLAYCINNLIISILGIVLGLFIGLLLMIYIVNYYKDLMLLPTVLYEIKPMSLILTIAITIFVVEVATLLATFELDRITPIEVMNNEKYHEVKVSKFANFVTSKLKPFNKLSLLVYIRNKKNLIIGIVCISSTFILVFSSLAYVTSKDKVFSQYFDDRINYDVQVFENDEITVEHLNSIRKLDYVNNADLLKYYNVTIKYGNKEIDSVVNAVDNTDNYVSIFNHKDKKIDYPVSGIVLEEHLANQIGAKKGDSVLVNDISFVVSDICFQSMGRVNYISINDSSLLSSSYDTIVVNMDLNYYDDFKEIISKDNNYVYSLNMDKLKEYTKAEFDSYIIPAIIIIIFSMVVGFIMILNINNYNLIDQKRNIALFRSLGIKQKEMSRFWFIQSIMYLVISSLIGLPFGIIISKIILKLISSFRREYVYASGFKEILLTIVLLFIYLVISHIIIMKNVKKIDIIEVMKERD